MDKIIIFDTTLRDGEQSPGVSLNLKEKVAIAGELARLGVDVIEAGFPIASPGDYEGVKAVSKEIKGATICGLARTGKEDILRAWDALQYAEKGRIHTFIATSPIHMEHKLRMNPEEVLESAIAGVELAKTLTDDVEFSAEDSFRSEMDFLCRVVEAVIKAGAKTINLPDTVGYALPHEYGQFIKEIIARVPNAKDAVFSVHCHNDLGLAVANSIAACEMGARQVEVAVNGIGERAGNASLEEFVMALHTRGSYLNLGTNINTKNIYRTSRLVSSLTGMIIQPNKAIVGKNAFLHESGIHQAGVLNERGTYEIMNPETIGITTGNIFLGKHSGRSAFRTELKNLGYELTDEMIDHAFTRFKELCDRKNEITEDDLIALADNELLSGPETYEFSYIQFLAGNNITPTATVGVIFNGEGLKEKVAIGKGAVEATYAAINKLVDEEIKLEDYKINSVTGGRDAQGEVMVKVSYKDRMFSGRGLSVDVIEASARAYLNAINKAINLTKMAEEKENGKIGGI